ncbi:MAG: glycosyltransferase [Candidatus Alcyoniella australis]|nr:glycosyltransferase [Candidatus Alcyoniella australis]
MRRSTPVLIVLALLAAIVGLINGGPMGALRAVLYLAAVLCGAVLTLYTLRRIISLLLLLLPRTSEPVPTESEPWPNLLLLVPCRNEAAVLPETISRLVLIEAPPDRLRVLLIDDGSNDNTAELLDAACKGRGNWSVFQVPPERAGAGKPAALNAALADEQWAEVVLVLDADDRVPPDWPISAAAQINAGADAVQFGLRIHNGTRNAVTAYCLLEQIVHQAGIVRILELAGNPPLLGHGFAIRLDTLRRAGMFPEGSRAEDVPLSKALHAQGSKVRFVREPLVEHLAPQSVRAYIDQHAGWSRAFASEPWWDPSGGLLARLAGLLYLLGYADRAALLVGLALALLAPLSGVAFPWWLIAAPLLCAALFAAGALLQAREPLALWLRLIPAPLIFLADMLAALRGQFSALRPGPQPWVVTPKPGGNEQTDVAHTWAVVVVHGKPPSLPRCLEALRRSGVQRGIVIADMPLLEHGRPWAAIYEPGFDFFYQPGNRGYAAAANVGLERAFNAGARHALLCNPDAFVDPDAVRALSRLADRHADCACVGALVRRGDDCSILEGFAGAIRPNQFLARIRGQGEPSANARYSAGPVDFPLGCCLLITRRGWNLVGGLDSELYCYHDELDWCERARARGLRCFVEPRATVEHAGPTSSMARIVKTYFLGRNAELLSRRLRGPGLRAVYLAACAAESALWILGRSREIEQVAWRMRGRRDARVNAPPDPWIVKRIGLQVTEDD